MQTELFFEKTTLTVFCFGEGEFELYLVTKRIEARVGRAGSES